MEVVVVLKARRMEHKCYPSPSCIVSLKGARKTTNKKQMLTNTVPATTSTTAPPPVDTLSEDVPLVQCITFPYGAQIVESNGDSSEEATTIMSFPLLEESLVSLDEGL